MATLDGDLQKGTNYVRPVIPLLGISILIICLDQLTKIIVAQHIDYYNQKIVVIEGFFNLRHDRNSGAAFSLMQGQRTLLIVATILAMIFIAYYYFQFRHSLWMRVGLGFILGGAIGNLIARSAILFAERYEGVVDFIDVGIGTMRWYTFNIADSAVTVGILFYLLHTLFTHKPKLVEQVD